MRPLASAVLRQAARRQASLALRSRTFVSSAKRLNSEETSTQPHLSKLMEQVSEIDSTQKYNHMRFRHPNALPKESATEVRLVPPASLKATKDHLQLRSSFHGYSAFPYYYLRDTCRCPRCVDPHSKQRSFRTSDIPTNIYPRQINWDGVSLEIKWANDIPGYGEEHETKHDFASLQSVPMNTHDNVSPSTRPFAWSKEMMDNVQHWVTFDDYMSNDAKFAESMRNLQRLGLIFVKDIPKSREMVKKISERMGPVRNSFYGETWDVRTVPQAKNVAYTNQFLGFHMDLLYMNEPPGYQLLHCLENSCEGGESLFADAFRVAEIMRTRYPQQYKILTKKLLGYEYMHNDHIYSNARPVFELDNRTGKVRNVNYSPPFQAPMPKTLDPHGTSNIVDFERWQPALKNFADQLQHEAAVFQLKLNPGECVIFANRRVVHARNKFNTASGSRWLAGAYVDEDALLSTFSTNARKFPSEWNKSDPEKAGKRFLKRAKAEKRAAEQARRDESAKGESEAQAAQ